MRKKKIIVKNVISKYKEIIISAILILAISSIIGIKYYNNSKNIKIADNNSNIKDQINVEQKHVEANSYYIENNKLYISFDGENIIEVPGDFYEMTQYDKETYQISKEKIVFFYNRKNEQYFVYSDDCGKTWSATRRKKYGTIKYIEFIDKNNGYMYEIKDTAMTIASGAISKTTDGGRTWKEIYHGIDGKFKTDSKVKFFSNNIGYITMPYNGGDTCELYVTQDAGKTFNKVKVNYIELEDSKFKWEEIYDYYNMPTKDNIKFYLEVGQGSDGDYNGGKSIQYYSYDGLSWTTTELEEKREQDWKKETYERVENRSEDIFLKDFQNYNPSSSDIKISQTDAEKIAEIGFKETDDTIGEAGDKERQTISIEEVIANNFFTSNPGSPYKIYKNIKRKCYIFAREDEMGCGAKVYIDVTTGLIIGGQCFGD